MTISKPHFQVVKHAAIAAASSGSNTVIAAVTGKTIRVLALSLTGAGTVTATFKSSTTSSLTGAISLAVATSVVLPYAVVGWMDTVAGEALTVALSGATAVAGVITYIEV